MFENRPPHSFESPEHQLIQVTKDRINAVVRQGLEGETKNFEQRQKFDPQNTDLLPPKREPLTRARAEQLAQERGITVEQVIQDEFAQSHLAQVGLHKIGQTTEVFNKPKVFREPPVKSEAEAAEPSPEVLPLSPRLETFVQMELTVIQGLLITASLGILQHFVK
jgi:hypothetical protein